MEKQDIRNQEDIRRLVDAFYDQARNDDLLKPIFDKIAPGDWPHHLSRIYEFWSGVLLHEGNYSGSPFLKHWPLGLEEHHYQRWVEIWSRTLTDLFEGEKATDARTRATVMAAMFWSKTQHYQQKGEAPLI